MPFKRKNELNTKNFDTITICLTSPDDILERSFGEVLKPETINYRTYKPERDGLFCERIFGPVKDYECYCGKYKRIRYKGIVCDRCGVEVTEKKVRRERMGHIKLVVPVVHIWFFKSLPNKIGYLLGLSSKKLESIIYYERYAVIQPGVKEGEIEIKELYTEEEYFEILDTLPEGNQQLDDTDPQKFIAKMGAEAVRDLLERLNLEELSYQLRHQAANETSQQRKSEALKRLRVVEAFRDGQKRIENKPEWAIIQYLPVIPPELRPLVPLDGGRFASSDLNDLYRRVIIRNNRLKRLLEIKAPEVILRNEKRMLQEAVDSLFDNSRKSNAVKAEGGRSLKSLSDILKGKQGRFRQNLLGLSSKKLESIIYRGIVKTVKSAKKLVDKKDPVIWEILENVLKGHPVLLNRAPTLHRLSIQAFQPKLVEGKAIQLHPLVTGAFNADFDGDQMAVHVPLSQAAVLEAQVLMLSSHNMLNPQNGTPITLPSQDMVLGLYYLTKEHENLKLGPNGKDLIFYSPEEVMIAYNEGRLAIHQGLKVRMPIHDEESKTELIETTVGRVLFNEKRPEGVPFINTLLTKKNLKIVISDIIKRTDFPTTASFLDQIKTMGFYWSFKGGLSFNLGDLINPTVKESTLLKATEQVEEIWDNYNMGLITPNERYNQVIDEWTSADNDITDNLMKELKEHKFGFNSVYMMLDSGARGSKQQIKQLCGLRGLMAKPRKSGDTGGAIIENPILSNFLEGLSVQDYFISTHGARKGLADTALKTADAGYLTRRLVDVSQDVIITSNDCDTLRGIKMTALIENDKIVQPLSDRIDGRFVLNDVYHPETDELILESGEFIDYRMAHIIEDAGIESIKIRSVLTCEEKSGVCAKCYGRNMATNRLAEKGDAVGIIAAQSIGEPGTQLTLRTFHVGGIASVTKTESEAKSKHDGVAEFDNVEFTEFEENGSKNNVVLSRSGEVRLIDPSTKKLLTTFYIQYGSTIHISDGQKIKKGDLISKWDPFNAVIITDFNGIIKFVDLEEGVSYRKERDDLTGNEDLVIIESKNKKVIPKIAVISPSGEELKSYNMPVGAYLTVQNGEEVIAGQKIVKIPRKQGQIQDITGGLPRVTELFEARNPSNPAVVSAIDGIVSFGKVKRGNQEVFVTDDKTNQKTKYLIKKGRLMLVQDGDFVRAGTKLSEGATSPFDILNIMGPYAVQQYLVNGIQEVYRSQGILINDKHIEVISRQMMRRVEIEDAGDTHFLEGEAVERHDFLGANDWIFDKKVIDDAGESTKLKPGQLVSLRQLREENSYLKRNDKKLVQFRDAISATSKPLLQGITRSSLGVRSWISAASFQETTKVLSTAAIAAKTDDLSGLKENVIAGKQIPAGTGTKDFRDFIVTVNQAAIEAEQAAAAAALEAAETAE